MRRRLFAALLLVLAAGFGALGLWQLERQAWKLDLIHRVEARIHALPQPLPVGRPVTQEDAYTRVRARGVFLHDRETLVQALTERGAGWWVMTPLRTKSGIVLVNRGFVPTGRRDAATRPVAKPEGPVEVVGLLRLSEPPSFLRRNDPVHDRWRSRDVPAIAAARRLGPVAPFFIDAEAGADAGGYPVAGLTVIRFRNTHLVYALTWFALAVLSLFGLALVMRPIAGDSSP